VWARLAGEETVPVLDLFVTPVFKEKRLDFLAVEEEEEAPALAGGACLGPEGRLEVLVSVLVPVVGEGAGGLQTPERLRLPLPR
jgi:hypothetical protein